MQNGFRSTWEILSKHVFGLILLLGFLNGLAYVWIVPPWEHYDEPGHFEHSWLIAHRLKLPSIGDYDQALGLTVGQSLIESRFFERRSSNRPNLTDPTQPLWMGVSQIEDPPLYYILTAVPLYIFQGLPVNWQLYSGRIVSLLFLLITIYAAHKITSELTPERHPLRWMVPLFIALLPGLVEFMTAMNDYPAAIGFISLWYLSAVRLLKDKWTIKQALILLILTVACLFTQKAVYYIVLFVPFILFFSLLPRKKDWIGWTVSITTVVVVLAFCLDWNDAAFWLRRNEQDFGSRTTLNQQSGLKFALQGKVYPDQLWGGNDPAGHSGFFQLVPIEISDRLKGKQVTIGAWVWTNETVQGYGPGINALYQFEDKWEGLEQVSLSTTPKFFASVITVPWELDRLQIWLRTTSPGEVNARIYFSGIVLVEGALPVEVPPKLDEGGSGGVWAGKPFTNLARNGQVAQVWPYLRPEIAHLLFEKVVGMNPTAVSSFIAVVLDYPGSNWYLSDTAERIFKTFWATFGWGQISLSKIAGFFHPYLLLLIITIIGIISSLVSMVWVFRPYRTVAIFLIILMSTTILVAFLYGVFTMGGALRFRAYLPVARYIFPAIIPISLILVTGWYGLQYVIIKYLWPSPKWVGALGILFLVLLNVYSFLSIIKYSGT